MGPRFFQTVTIYRSTVKRDGSLQFAAGVPVSGSVWDRRRKAIVGQAGEVHTVTAQGFLPATADVRLRDHLVVGGRRFEVLHVVSGHDDRGTLDHVGVELRDTDAS
jgi:hypothetical protein